ncbi:MAG: hypothetical protein MRQ09_00630 [Candidatus Midichloria sp.]|nr:hypothetical protein [Candidatus Midichloria sp.]
MISVSTEECRINQCYTVNIRERLEKFDVIGAKAYRVHCSSYTLEETVSGRYFRPGQSFKEKSKGEG